MAKNIGTGTAATLYKCQRCNDGTMAVWRGRLPEDKGTSRKTALCAAHRAEAFGLPTVADADHAERVAYGMLGADGAALWALADRSAGMDRHLAPTDRERKADAIRDRFVAMVTEDLQADGTLAHNGVTLRPIDVLRAATRSHVNLSRDIGGDATEWTAVPALGQNTSTGWDADILAEMDLEDQLALTAFAESDEPDGREPTRHEAAAFIAGRCIPARTVTDRVREAAGRYAELRAARDAMLAR